MGASLDEFQVARFGHIKNSGFRAFSLRGHKKAGGEFSLICVVHNFKKIGKVILKGNVCLEAVELAPVTT